MTSTKTHIQKLSVALNIIAAACSMLIGIPWFVRHNRQDYPPPTSQQSDISTPSINKILRKLQTSGYSSLTNEERALITNSMKGNK